MNEEVELSGEAADHWFQQFESADEFERVVEEADVAVGLDDLSRESVLDEGETVKVELRHHVQGSDEAVTARGEFNAENSDLLWAEIEEAYVASPLAGHGRVWHYEDGDVEKKTWMA